MLYKLVIIDFDTKNINVHVLPKDAIPVVSQPMLTLNDEDLDLLIEKGRFLFQNVGAVVQEVDEVEAAMIEDYFNPFNESLLDEAEENRMLT